MWMEILERMGLNMNEKFRIADRLGRGSAGGHCTKHSLDTPETLDSYSHLNMIHVTFKASRCTFLLPK